MSDVISILQSIVPEINDMFASRLAILRLLDHTNKRLGRKLIAESTYITERAVRTNLDTLKAQALVDVNHQGVIITSQGVRLLQKIDISILNNANRHYFEMEEKLKRKLGIDHCVIVPGDADLFEDVYLVMGELVQEILLDYLPTGENIISVTGGSTLSKIGEAFTPELSQERNITFVPSRGGLGGEIKIQSNSVGSLMAMNTHAKYLPLFIPETLNQETSDLLMKDSSIKQVVEMSKDADALLLSVGRANIMADRRSITIEQQEIVKDKQAVGEAFGVFFDKEGKAVLRYPRIGLKIEDLKNIPLLITIAGGSSKAEAVEAFYKLAPNHGWLVCDESIANSILNGETL